MDSYLNKLAKKLTTIKSEKEMSEFLNALLTPDELKTIPLRLEIVKLLKEEKTAQHEIAKRLKVGIATVTRGSRELKLNHFKNV